VQHPCSRCGAAVDNSSPFCPACEAPQIQFTPHEPDRESVRLHPETVPFSPVQVASATAKEHVQAVSSARRRWLRAGIYAGAIGFVLNFLPTGPMLALPIAGWLAVRFYTRMVRFPIRPKEGFRLGALAGLVTSAILFVLGTATMSAPGSRGEVRQAMLEMANRAHGLNPQIQPEQFVDYIFSPAGIVMVILLSCVIFVVLSGLGGLISAFISSRRLPR
jgi:hypothetical protein